MRGTDLSSFTFDAYGHPSVRSTHPSTIEITKETHLTENGDCVIAVNSEIGPRELPDRLQTLIKNPGAMVMLVVTIGSHQFVTRGKGNPRLTLSHPTDFVIRKSGFISDRTLMIHADKVASDLSREMVVLLRDPKTRVTIEISASAPE